MQQSHRLPLVPIGRAIRQADRFASDAAWEGRESDAAVHQRRADQLRREQVSGALYDVPF